MRAFCRRDISPYGIFPVRTFSRRTFCRTDFSPCGNFAVRHFPASKFCFYEQIRYILSLCFFFILSELVYFKFDFTYTNLSRPVRSRRLSYFCVLGDGYLFLGVWFVLQVCISVTAKRHVFWERTFNILFFKQFSVVVCKKKICIWSMSLRKLKQNKVLRKKRLCALKSLLCSLCL